MKSIEKKHAVIDLRGAKTRKQKHFERLRNKAKQSSEYYAVSSRAYEQPAISKTISSLRKIDQNEMEKQSKKAWNDVVSGVFRVASIALVVAGSWAYLPSITSSLAYFTDTEGASASMTSGFIDLIASSSPEVTELECGGMADPEVYIETDGNPVNVTASTTGIMGNVRLCNAMDLDVRLLGETVYSGPLSGFHAEDVEDGTMRFVVSLPDDAGPFPENAECVMNIEYTAIQKRHGGVAGFSDKENINLAFSVDSESCDSGCGNPCPCDCCGDLDVDVTNDNDGTITNDFDISTNTGGNDASGGDNGGDGGEIDTGDATTEVDVTNELNINEIIIDENCSGDCCDSGDEDCVTDEDEVTEETVDEDCEDEQDTVCENVDENNFDEGLTDESVNDEPDEDVNEECNEEATGEECNNDVESSPEDLLPDISDDMDNLTESIQDRINEHMGGILGSSN